VLVAGERCPLVGRVMMDQFLVDITSMSGEVHEGDEVVLIGEQGAERIGAGEIATLEDTISWEVLAALTARLPRLYVRGDLVF
jgi:alanine racemase